MSRTIRDHEACSGFGYFFIGVSSKGLGHDRKPGCKPPSWWKRPAKRSRRAKERQAFRADRDIPRFPKTDMWEWN